MPVTNIAPPGIRRVIAFGNQTFLDATKQIRDEFKDRGYDIDEGSTTEMDVGRICISLNGPTETGIEELVINVHNEKSIGDETLHSEGNMAYINIGVKKPDLQFRAWELIRRLDSELPEHIPQI